MKLMICGHARHGKDTLAEMLGLKYASSSQVALEHVIWPEIGHLYQTKDACFNDRSNKRELWHGLITAYNQPDLTKLARIIFSSNDVYVGIRNREEFYAAKSEGLFDISIWVDASGRLPPEPESSNKMKPSDCDIIITNNGSHGELQQKVARLKPSLGQRATIDSLQQEVVEWANSVMPNRTITNACTKLVMEEIPEFLTSDNDPMEYADIFIILLDMAYLSNINIKNAIREKMAINRNRKWGINKAGLLKHEED